MSDSHEYDARREAGTSAEQNAATNPGASAEASTRTTTEEFRVSGERVIAEIKELIRQGNVRRITIKNDEGRSLIEIPLTVGVIGTLLLPVWAAIGAIAALAANLTLSVERRQPADGSESADPVAEPRTNGTA